MNAPAATTSSWPPPGSTVVAVSPHLDDAVFSAGALLHDLAATGVDVHVVTVFTGNVEEPTGFALACQTDKGLPPHVDYMALRRAEDRAATAQLGVRGLHLPLLEAPHRGYEDPAALFGDVHPDDRDQAERIAVALRTALDATCPDGVDLLLGPAALGDHVDHRHVRDAVRALSTATGAPHRTWADLPYALRLPAVPAGLLPSPASAAARAAKLRAAAAYTTQLPFQFGDVRAMTAALGDHPEAFTA